MDTETASITKQLWVGLACAAFISLGLFLLFSRSSVAVNGEGEKLVTIHDNYADTAQTIVTRASTVGAALAKARVAVSSHDAVEPVASTPLGSGSYNVNVYHARPVTIIDGSTTLHIISASQSATELAQLAGLTVYPEDVLEVSQISDFVGDRAMGLKLVIHRATPLTLVLYGQPMITHTMTKTVDEMLTSKGVRLSAQDGTSLPLTMPITAGMTVEVWRNGVKTQTLEEPIPFTTKKIQATDQPVGYKLVQTKGVNGKQLVTYQVNLQNGKEVSRTKIQAVEVTPMTEQVEIVGTKPSNGLTKAKGVDFYQDSRGVVHRETYYDLPMSKVMGSCGGGSYSIRADGAKVDKDGYILIAANLERYPRCSIVETSLGLGKVYDTGGFAVRYPDGFDLATDWTDYNGL